MKKSNVVKAWITSIVGVIVMMVTLLLLMLREINFIMEGMAGFSIGTILLFSPRTLERFVEKWINKDKKPEDTQ